MSYYFPLGGSQATTLQNISHSLYAITSSVPVSSATRVLTSSFASTSGSVPQSGSAGLVITQFACDLQVQANSKLLVSGSKGLQGPTGSVGTDNNSCPPGTIECVGLNVSLSAAFTGYPYGLNHTLPSGSRYSKVCIEIPSNCTVEQVGCPGYLPIAEIPTIP